MGSSVNIPDMSANLRAKVTGGRPMQAHHTQPHAPPTSPPPPLVARSTPRCLRPPRPASRHCAVSEEQQSDPSLLAAVYDDMAAKFQQNGLNLPAVEAMRQYFTNLEGAGGWCG